MRRSVNHRVKREFYLAEKDADRADVRDATLFAEGARRRHSSGTRVDVFQSEGETRIPGRDLYACILV